jgi:hypothetical protein
LVWGWPDTKSDWTGHSKAQTKRTVWTTTIPRRPFFGLMI